jgi:hypothetical protein
VRGPADGRQPLGAEASSGPGGQDRPGGTSPDRPRACLPNLIRETRLSLLAELTLGRAVTLTPGAQDDTDRYGRLLRYVDASGADPAVTLLQQGLAVARYDSRDGYGPHPRESAYIAADAAAPQVCPA